MSRSSRFASDNVAPVHPDVLQALADANVQPAAAYGNDPLSRRVVEDLRATFGGTHTPYLCTSGTAANVMALAIATQPGARVLCSDEAHIHVDEAGGPERIAGAKLVPLPTDHGLLAPETVMAQLTRDDVHAPPAAAVSISQATEQGTTYTPAQVRALADLAHERGLLLHVDGARLCNAAAADGDLAAHSTAAGADLVSFGVTKDGAMAAEVLLVADHLDQRRAATIHKQLGQLTSKMRYVAAQLEAMFSTDEAGVPLWQRCARNANAMAIRLAEGLAAVDGVEVAHDVQADLVFSRMAPEVVSRLEGAGYHAEWFGPHLRLACAWDTSIDDVDALLADLRGAG